MENSVALLFQVPLAGNAGESDSDSIVFVIEGLFWGIGRGHLYEKRDHFRHLLLITRPVAGDGDLYLPRGVFEDREAPAGGFIGDDAASFSDMHGGLLVLRDEKRFNGHAGGFVFVDDATHFGADLGEARVKRIFWRCVEARRIDKSIFLTIFFDDGNTEPVISWVDADDSHVTQRSYKQLGLRRFLRELRRVW